MMAVRLSMSTASKLAPVKLGSTESTSTRPDGAEVEPIIRSEALRRVITLSEKVARHPAAVLIMGETGTGKEMIARSIHANSIRCSQPWVDVNCAAIPEHLVESELFGYEKGAFSGADQTKPGFFELADKGTLFLDEIGDLDLKIQVKLLRVLDGVPYYRLGGSKKVEVDVRIVAATNQNLEDLVKAGKFRSDLYHRLSQFQLTIPPLRDRTDDIVAIAEAVLHQHFPQSKFSPHAMQGLLTYSWPGNVRELKNVIFKAVLQGKNAERVIEAEDLALPNTKAADPSSGGAGDLNEMERSMILKALEACGGNQGAAAQQLGISRRTLSRKLKVYRSERESISGDPVPGSLSVEQKRYFRSTVNETATLIAEGDELRVKLLNISLGGAAILAHATLKAGSKVWLRFHLPGTDHIMQIQCAVAWNDPDGEHGLQFLEMAPHFHTHVERWLLARMDAEGWQPQAPE
jgi:transcriptional regulator with PAS, ATPase and Fis domain